MRNIFQRLLYNIGRVLSAIFNIGVRLKYVVLLCAVLTFGTYYITSHNAIERVGGKEDYNEAMRYIEIKDIVDEKFIDEANRAAMGDSASAAMISGLGDPWSYFMTADEYKTYQLSATNEYSTIGMTIS